MKVSTVDVNNIQSGSKTAKSVADIMGTTGEFKKLLQTKQEESTEKVPTGKTTSNKPEKEIGNTEAPDNTEKAQTDNPATGDAKDSLTAEKTVEFYAAQGLRPEMVIPSEQTPTVKSVENPIVEEVAAIQEPAVSMDADVKGEMTQAFENDGAMANQQAAKEGTSEFQTAVKQTAEMQETAGQAQTTQTVSQAQQGTERNSEEANTEAGRTEEYQAAAGTAGTAQESAAASVQSNVQTQSETSTMHVPNPQELPEQLGENLSDKIARGVQEFEIQIEPRNLGKIAIKIAYVAGQATVSVICSEKRTMELIGQNAREIGQLIDRNLGGTTTIIVDEQQQKPDYLNQHREGENRGQQQEQKDGKKDQQQDNREEGEFLQKLRLGLLS